MAIWYSVVVPMYNEEEVIEVCYERLNEVMQTADHPYELIFVDDGSRDGCADIIREKTKTDSCVKLISFSRNFGHQAAISCGMQEACGKAIVVIDADLQDPPEVILQMIAKWKEGFDVVYGKRAKRKRETIFKKLTAKCFYRLLNCLSDITIPTDTGDFRLIDRKVCDVLNNLTEKNRYIRGLVSFAGFRQTAVPYVREGRYAGETKYPLRKMLKFAEDATTSFSNKPLKIAGITGFIISVASFVELFVTLYLKLFTDRTVTGWASIVSLLFFFNGVILIMLGIMGSYIGRIYDEVKNRPLYIVRERYGGEEMKDKEE